MSILNNLPAANSYNGMFVNAMNFPPADFNFYQHKYPLLNNQSIVTNELRGAFLFSNSDCYVANASVNLGNGNPLNELTFECWVKCDPDNINISGVIFSYHNTVGNNVVQVELYDPYNLSLVVNLNGGTTLTTQQNIADGEWHHIAIVFSLNQPIKFFLDTREVYLANNVNYDVPFPDQAFFIIGNGSVDTVATYFKNGMIGQVRIWTEARSLVEIISCAGRYLRPEQVTNLPLYWSNQYNASTGTITNSGHNSGNDGTADSAAITWDTESLYGGLVDNSIVVNTVSNMTGNAEIDNTQAQSFLTSISGISAITTISVECWIRIDSSDNTSQTIFAVYNGSNNHLIFSIENPAGLQVVLNGTTPNVLNSYTSITDGEWHYLALTWTSGSIPLLYVDGTSVTLTGTSTNYTWSDPTHITSWIVSAAGVSNPTINNSIQGGISELRVWKSIRSQEEIYQDGAYRLYNTNADLILYWPFSRSFEGKNYIEDFSGLGNDGRIYGGPTWSNTEVFGFLSTGIQVPPTLTGTEDAGPPSTSWQYGQVDLTAVASGGTIVSGAMEGFPNLTVDELEQALTDAKTTGYFDPVIFPNIYFTNLEDTTSAKNAIQDLDFNVFLSYWISGRRLNFSRGGGMDMYYNFIPVPKDYGPTLLLLLDTRITSYYGDTGGGQVVRTFSLMPGESTYISIDTYKKTTEQEESTSSIFDSNNTSAQTSFQNSLNINTGVDTSLAAALDFHASAESKVRWIEGNLDVNGSVGASLEANLQAHLQVVSNAMSSHANNQSSKRNVEVNTSYTVTTESGSNTAITREFKNVNNSRTLNIIFKQVNQQIVAQQMLTNIRIGYFDPAPGSYRTVQLSQLDDLLDQVLLDNAATKLSYKNTIVTAAYMAASQGICNYNINGFIRQIDKGTGVISNIPLDSTSGAPIISSSMDYFILPSGTSSFTIAGQSTSAQGVVLSTDYYIMRTDNVVADLELGETTGLDTYAQGLQAQAVRREQVENTRIEMDNQQAAAALEILELAAQENNDPGSLADLYHQLFMSPAPDKKIIHTNVDTTNE